MDELGKLAQDLRDIDAARQRLLDETHDHYVRDKKPFGLSPMGSCIYYGDNGVRCAIGRLMRTEDAIMFRNVIAPCNDENVWWHLPAWVQLCGKNFVREVQKAHDTASGYDDGGAGSRDALAKNLAILAAQFNLKAKP